MQIATSRYPPQRYPNFQPSVSAKFQLGGGLKREKNRVISKSPEKEIDGAAPLLISEPIPRLR
jgi:hypothetical protein